jgi:hypothetical protein
MERKNGILADSTGPVLALDQYDGMIFTLEVLDPNIDFFFSAYQLNGFCNFNLASYFRK